MIPQTAFSLLQQQNNKQKYLSFGCKIIDNALGGGIPVQGVTEISGVAGAGKSQVCLTLALQAQLSSTFGGLSGSVAYLSCGEGEFPIRRLSQVASFYEIKTKRKQSDFLKNVHIEQCYSVDDIHDSLTSRIPEMIRNQGIKLLIIDSLAGIIRHDFDTADSEDMRIRTAFLFSLSQKLKWLADTYNVCVVVVNQATADNFDEIKTQKLSISGNVPRDSKPALGLAWSHCINTRIILYRDTNRMRAVTSTMKQPLSESPHKQALHNNTNNGRDSPGGRNVRQIVSNFNEENKENIPPLSDQCTSSRTMCLEFSPHRPQCSVDFRITSGGVLGVSA